MWRGRCSHSVTQRAPVLRNGKSAFLTAPEKAFLKLRSYPVLPHPSGKPDLSFLFFSKQDILSHTYESPPA